MTPQQLADDLSIDVRELRTWLRNNHPRGDADKGRPWAINSSVEREARVAFGQPPSLGTDLKNLSSDVHSEISELASEVAETIRGASKQLREAFNDAKSDVSSEIADDSPTP